MGVMEHAASARRGLSGMERVLASLLQLIAAVIMAIILAGAQARANQDTLGGAYYGVDAAEGWRIELEPTPDGFSGRFIDHTNRVTPFVASGSGASAVADRVTIGDGAAFFDLTAHPIGLFLVWIPVSNTDDLIVEDMQSFSFLRADVTLPEPPEDLAPPPIEITPSFDSMSFLNSYEFWSPDAVGRGYASLTPRSRILIRLYALVHADVLWKLCRAAVEPPGLFEALDGQGVTCADVLDRVAQIQRSGAFTQFKADLAVEKEALMRAASCAMGGLDEERCRAATERTSQAAISLETTRTVLWRY